MTPFVRVSTIEMYRRVIQTEYQTAEELQDYIRNGQASPTQRWQMDAGTAWHKVLEDCGLSDGIVYSRDGYSFAVEAVEQAMALRGPGLHEMTARRTIDTPAARLVVKGTADHVRGLLIRDAKTKFTGADPKDYEPSLQWRFYLWLFEAARFTYDLFEFREPTDEGFCAFKGVMSFSFWTYPTLGAECRRWAGDFLAWADARGLTRFLVAPQQEAVI